MSAIVDKLMHSPVSLGGFTFSFGFVYKQFGHGQERERDWTLIAAKHRPEFHDVRAWPTEDQRALWDAMGVGDTAVISGLCKKYDSESGQQKS